MVLLSLTRISAFYGPSRNAVLIQMWTALIAYLLLAWLKLKTKGSWGLIKIYGCHKPCSWSDGSCGNFFEVDPVFLDMGLGDNQWTRRTGRWQKIGILNG